VSVCLNLAGRLFHTQPRAGSHRTLVPKVAVGRPDDTSPRVSRTQLTMTFFRWHLTVSSQVNWNHVKQRMVDQHGHLEVHSFSNLKHCDFYRAMHFIGKHGILSVRPCVTFRYRDHIGWNSSKIISRLISLGSLLLGAPTSAIWFNGNTSIIGVRVKVRIFHHLLIF